MVDYTIISPINDIFYEYSCRELVSGFLVEATNSVKYGRLKTDPRDFVSAKRYGMSERNVDVLNFVLKPSPEHNLLDRVINPEYFFDKERKEMIYTNPFISRLPKHAWACMFTLGNLNFSAEEVIDHKTILTKALEFMTSTATYGNEKFLSLVYLTILMGTKYRGQLFYAGDVKYTNGMGTFLKNNLVDPFFSPLIIVAADYVLALFSDIFTDRVSLAFPWRDYRQYRNFIFTQAMAGTDGNLTINFSR